jgi:uncharacterized protein
MRIVPVGFRADGLRLDGLLHVPEEHVDGERRAAIVVCHGRYGIKEWIASRWTPPLVEAGYVCLSFDYRNLGRSEGTLGRLIPQEEVRDLHAAVSFLAARPEVDGARLGVLGWGLGGGVAIEGAAHDERLRAVVCASGLVDGARHDRHRLSEEAWEARRSAIERDRHERVRTGVSGTISTGRFPDDRPVEETDGARSDWLRSLIETVGWERATDPVRLGIPARVTLESLDAFDAFRPIDVVDRLSPRPVLFAHVVDDAEFPYDHVLEAYHRAGEPKRLLPVEGATHRGWIDPGTDAQRRYVPQVIAWLRDALHPATVAG